MAKTMSLAYCLASFHYVLAVRNLAPVEGGSLNCYWRNIEEDPNRHQHYHYCT